ncbi:transmembrane protein 244-like [Sinocyclocheilus grahami]|uniref:transmembrane protein 244-like n=1 Tax=Sinocyclocheilus grahami TaxID=75366 RepID=UPI0007ACD641|nr:PREDICTED: transmembrane protein 244-like [Sinocyclocheilus grahami]
MRRLSLMLPARAPIKESLAIRVVGLLLAVLWDHGQQLPLNSKLHDTWAVLQNLLMCMLCFFSLYYIVVSLCISGVFSECDLHGGDVCSGRVEVWDYAITVTLLHVALTVAVMADFPSTEHWWIALGSGLLMLIFGGQLLAYRLFRSNFVHPADLQNL